MNVLEKISGIEICPDTRISEQDRQFCIINQNAYDTAKADLDCIRKQWDTLVKNQEDILSASTESDYEKYRFIWINGFSSRDIKKKIEILPKIFIETIVNYFNNRYHVSINSDEVKRIFIPKEPEWSWEKRITEEYHKTMLVLTVYRGVTSYNSKSIKVMSWTLSLDTAKWFSNRFGEKGTVYKAHIRKQYVFALLNGRNESEVVVDPEYLTDVIKMQD